MKLLIVLGLFPLFSAQQFDFGSYSSGYNNNNNLWSGLDFNSNSNNNFGGLGYSSGSNSNIDLSLDSLNNGLIQQLRLMTNSLASMLKQVAKDPRANEVFKAMDKICVSNMDETIQILKVGSNAAEKALLDADQLLDSAVAGKLPNNGQKNNY